MKLNILSDLHLSRGTLAAPGNDADVVILAGDIGRPEIAIEWASALGKPALYVPGNHEFYGGTLQGTLDRLQALAAGGPVRVLHDETVVIDGVRFVGSTLWTDFRLGGEGEARTIAQNEALARMHDFRRIHWDESRQRPFTPADAAQLFERHAVWLQRTLAQPHAGPTVVITHHAPSARSIEPRFASSPLSACFASHAEHLLMAGRPQLWIHGHMHHSVDYRVGDTRVVCNPRGYLVDGQPENPRFDPDWCVTVGQDLSPFGRLARL